MEAMEITEKRPKFWSQWIAAGTLHVLAILDGLSGGWTSPYLAKLTNRTESLAITNEQASWIATLYLACQPLGSILAAVIIHKIGAKKAVLFAGIPHAIGWSCFLISESVPSIYIARVCNGAGLGMYYCTFPLYIGEIGSPKIRGALIGVVVQGTGIGYLVGYCLGAYLSMKTFAIIGLAMTFFFMLSFALIPDSSHYLIKRNRYEEAEKSLKWYNRKENVSVEMEALMAYLGEPKKISVKGAFKQFLTPLNRKILTIIISIHALTHLSGAYIISMYMEILLATLKVDIIAPSLVVIFVGIVAIMGGLVTMYTNDHFGRRTMFAISSLGVSVSFVLIGINFLLLRYDCDISGFQRLIIAEFMAFIFFVNIGLLNIPCCLVSEIFSPELKEIGSCLTNISCAVAAFIAGKSYQPLLDSTSEEFIFFLSAAILFITFVYTIAIVPETKGKSLREIQEMLVKRSERIKVDS